MSHPYDAIRLDELRKRRSMKWHWYPEDVLPAWVAEMDFPLAEPIRAVLMEMAELGDTGYAWPGDVAEAYAEWSAERLGFAPDPGRSAVVQDVMRGFNRTHAPHPAVGSPCSLPRTRRSSTSSSTPIDGCYPYR